MGTEIERIDKLESNMIDVKIRLGVAESDIKSVKETLKKIDHNTSKILWGIFGIFGTIIGTVVVALVNHYFK